MTSIAVGPNPLAGYNTTTYTKADVTSGVGSAAWTTANSPITLWTITGTVIIRVVGVVGATALTSVAATGTLAVGIPGSVTTFLPTTTVSAAGQFLINGVWVNSTPTTLAAPLVAADLTFDIAANTTVILTIATNNMSAGAIVLYANWTAITPGATVS